MKHEAESRLATYGTLRPGDSNHHQLADLCGEWTAGTVRGHVLQVRSGPARGYPGLILDPEGDTVEVELFHCDQLRAHWARLDAFEGEGYRRVMTQVSTLEGQADACIYVLAPTSVASSGI